MITVVFKRTSDDWYPSYKVSDSLSLVEVTFTQTGPNPPYDSYWRVCIWGADDCGMEKDFEDETQAWNCFLQVIGFEDVTREALLELGFSSA